ncbi:hypothetical protein Q7C36_000487 [Tachysurus vachellii]|uniref:Ig-like domain-containing protein n=1 Tax=Tachysurus vachellii TaxID=175792 RepID=A0AA88NXN5_TACVA|nr:hypothetical protein Q7C36_000487 [Tachysurus vachellii]
MLWCTSNCLRLAVTVALCLTVTNSAEQQLLCSSDSMTVWWEYEGPLYHFTVSTEPCSNGMDVINANYTLVTKFSVARAGYTITCYYRNQLWVEFSQPAVPCTDLKICNIVKGETLTETLSLPINPFNFPEGEYRVQGHLSIIDNLEPLCLNLTGFAEQQLLCSSDSLTVWWEYEGPVVLTSVEMSDCSTEEKKFTLTYTGMPLFTMVQLGWHLSVLYKNETLFTLYKPLESCEDFRICDLIKGERIHETIPFTINPYFTPNGEYQLIATANIIDDFDRELTVTIKSTQKIRANEGHQFKPTSLQNFSEVKVKNVLNVQSSGAAAGAGGGVDCEATVLASAFTEPKRVVNHGQDRAGLGVGCRVPGDLVGLGYGTLRFFPPPPCFRSSFQSSSRPLPVSEITGPMPHVLKNSLERPNNQRTRITLQKSLGY